MGNKNPKTIRKKWANRIIKEALQELGHEGPREMKVVDCMKIVGASFGLDVTRDKIRFAERVVAARELNPNASLRYPDDWFYKPPPPKRAPASRPQEELISEFYHSWEWKRVRYDFLKGRQRRCECCGATPEHGVRIVVDHIKPIRHYWDLRLDPANLQLLCDDCNMGKGSRDETDWRPSALH
jgi:hypothetical protein